MKNYVISLSNATQRRQHITAEFTRQNVSFEFFDAITFNDIDVICDKLNTPNLKLTNHLANSEKGCFLSHLSLWQKMLDDNLEWIAIFEDDVHLGENAHLFLMDNNWLNSEYGLIKIEHFYSELNLGSAICSINNRQIQPLYSANLGTAGYVIHQQTAKKLLDLFKTIKADDIIAIDHFMFIEVIDKKQISVFQLNPALCIQSDRLNPETHLTSDIHQERRQRMDNEKKQRTFMQKVQREFTRLFNQANQKSTPLQNIEFK